jgi:hypothetical protein
MPTVLYLSPHERVDLFKVTALEAHTGAVVAEPAGGDPINVAPGESLIDPQTPLTVTGPGRIKYWVEGEPYESASQADPAPRGDAGGTGGSYEARTVTELRKLAKSRKVKGYSKMSKEKLIATLRAAE